MKKHRKAKNEFRYNFSEKHKTYVFEEENGKYKSVGITHNSKTFGKNNMPLHKNPQKNKTDTSYIRNGIIVDKKNNYGKRTINNMSFESNDFKNVKSKIRNYKKRQKNSK